MSYMGLREDPAIEVESRVATRYLPASEEHGTLVCKALAAMDDSYWTLIPTLATVPGSELLMRRHDLSFVPSFPRMNFSAFRALWL